MEPQLKPLTGSTEEIFNRKQKPKQAHLQLLKGKQRQRNAGPMAPSAARWLLQPPSCRGFRAIL